jgi:hypothetical protein
MPAHPVSESYWREKEKVAAPQLKVAAHQCIIAYKSAYFASFFKEKRAEQESSLQQQKDEGSHQPLVIDFNGQVCYEAFRKIIDYIYLDDH